MNLPWIDGEYDHDFGVNPINPSWGTTYRARRSAQLLDNVRRMKANVVRVWVFENLEGLRFDARGHVAGLDPILVSNFENFVDLAEKNGLALYLVLSNNLADVRADVITDAAARQAYLDNAVVPFVKLFAGRRAIFAYEVLNEIENAIGVHGVTKENIRAFLAESASAIHAADPGRMVSSSIALEYLSAGLGLGLGLDFYDFHRYEDAWNLPACTALHVDRPVILGEFGQATERVDDGLQSHVVDTFQAGALSAGYAGVIYWDYGGSDDTGYHAITHTDGSWRPAAFTFREFTYR